MNTKGLTVQQKSVAVVIRRLWMAGTPPTVRQVAEQEIAYRPEFLARRDDGVRFRFCRLGVDATNSVVRALVKRGIVEQAGVADRNAKTWKVTPAAEPLVAGWDTEIHGAEEATTR